MEETGTERVRMPKTPVVPTDLERELHEINHIPLRSWCSYCTRGKAKDAGHYLVVGFHNGIPVIQMDFTYLFAERDDTQATVLNITDCESDAIAATQAPTKSPDDFLAAYAVNAINNWEGKDHLAQ